ncbi:PBP1A family penicillin-binding protein [Desulfovibrio sp. OttesenSCG-928-I05]|nr:PBP1A family penicillin-binding protein [Desulfovibrio sp. OttesenSCG-928-I05]
MKRFALYSALVLAGLAAIGACAAAAMIYWASRDLPSYTKLADYRLPMVTTVYARDGSVMGYFYKERRFPVTLEQMPHHLRQAFIAAEDANFYEHMGIDPLAIVRAAIRNFQAGQTTQGASTITQQIIKRLLLTDERTYTRKIKEAILAYRLEKYLGKDEILSIYLNEIYLGNGAYGVEAAARAYFGKHIQDITLAEAAVLASLPKAPATNNPYKDPVATKGRQSYVLGRMVKDGWITQAERDLAYGQPLIYQSMPDPGKLGGWYLEEVRRTLKDIFAEDNVRAKGIPIELYGDDAIYTAGLNVYTAMVPEHQTAAETALRKSLLETTKRQGWRGPIENIPEENRAGYLEKHPFNPGDLDNARWVKALVTAVTPKGAEVALGEYKGYIDVQTMSWCREPNPRQAPDGITIKDATKVVAPGDVVWVSAVGATGTASPVGAPHREPTAQDKKGVPAYNSNDVDKETPIALCIEQMPDVEGALVSIEVPDGDVVALVGGYGFSSENQFNRATQARRQPGSSFKPIVYSAALDNGFTTASLLQDSPFVSQNEASGQLWRPSNYDSKFLGSMILRTALAKSRNLCTVQVAQRLGMIPITDRAKELGIDDHITNDLAVSLGAYAVSPLTMARAYTAFANQGNLVTPRMIIKVTDNWGQTLVDNAPESVQAISPQNAFIMATLLKDVVNAGTATKAKVLGRPVGGKTGTSNEERDTWFIGVSPYLVTSVYTGFDQVRSLGRLETGGRTALPAFIYYRQQVDEMYEPVDFTPPDSGIVYATVDGKTGYLAGPNTTESYYLPFVQGTQPTSTGSSSTVQTGEDIYRQMF